MTHLDGMALQRPAALSESAADLIRTAIVEGEFGLGETLPEAMLTRRLGISKTPIREALLLLKKEGLVETFPQRGAFVFSLTLDDIRQLCEFRFALESLALDTASSVAREALAHELGEICGAMRKAHEAGDHRCYLELDRAFHDAFFDKAGNRYFRTSYDLVGSKIATIRTHLSRGRLRTDLSLKEHEAICTALRDGANRRARGVLRKQIFRGVVAYAELISDPNDRAR